MKKKYVMEDWVFEGEVNKEGMPEGEGMMNYNDGKVLKATFKNGIPIKGNFHMIDSVYEGEFNPDAQPDGKGKLEFISGDYKDQKFEGIFKDGKYSKGKYSYTDGSYYNGEWFDGVPNGKGELHQRNQEDSFHNWCWKCWGIFNSAN